MTKIKRVSINDFGNTLTEYEDGTSVYVCRYSELGTHYEDDPDSVETLDDYRDQFPSEDWREVWPAGGVMNGTPVDTYVDCYDETSVMTLDPSHESGLIVNVNDMYSDTGRGIYLNKEQARELASALTAYADGEW